MQARSPLWRVGEGMGEEGRLSGADDDEGGEDAEAVC